MTQLLKAALVSLVIALSLTSDTASTSTAETVQYLSNNSASCGGIGQRPRYWECRNWTFQPATLPCVSTPK